MDIISQLREAGIVNVNLQAVRQWEEKLNKNLQLLKNLFERTSYLDKSATLYERLINVRLGITELPQCELCAVGLTGKIWVSKCCYPRFCTECRHQHVTECRVKALLADDSKLAKSISQKSLVTQRERGTLESRIKKGLETKRANGQCIPADQVPAYRQYRSDVYSITRKQPLHLLENIERRGAIQKGGWHLDHQYSVQVGFLNKISPKIIGHFANLKMIPGPVNVKKQEQCSITLAQLKKRIRNPRSYLPESQAKLFDHQHALH